MVRNERKLHVLLFLVIILWVTVGSCKKEEVINVTTTGREALSDPSIKPSVLFMSPANGSVGPYSNLFDPGDNYQKAHAVIHFNKFIDLSTVNSQTVRVQGFDSQVPVYVIPTSTGYSEIVSLIVGYSGSSSYRYPYVVGRTYTLILDSTIQDVNGNKLGAPIQISYRPEPTFRVVSNYPKDGTADVIVGYTGLSFARIIFNSKVSSSILSSLQLTPTLAGRWSFSSDSTAVYFYADSIPLFNSLYVLTVSSTARDRLGNAIVREMRSSFRTAEFKVISSSPADSAIDFPLDSYSSSVYVNFSGPIDTGSVRSAFSISPALAGTFDFGSFSTTRSSFYFFPSVGFASNTAYTISLGTGIRSANGINLGRSHSIRFRTAQFAFIGSSPNDGAREVSPTTQLYLTTNGRIDTSSVRSSFSIIPNVVGSLSMSSGSNSFAFYPTSSGFAVGTNYTVTIGPNLRHQGGGTTGVARSFSFSTQSFKVAYTTPSHGQTGVSFGTSVDIRVECNASLDTSTIRGAFSLSPPASGTFYIYSSSPNYFIYWITGNGLAAGTVYTATVGTSLRSRSGANLTTPYRFSFTTAPFQVYTTTPANGDTNVSATQPVYVQFNAYPDTASVRAGFSISPASPGTILMSPSNTYIEFRPTVAHQQNVVYTVTLASSVRAYAGGTLGTPYQFSFKVSPFRVTSTSPSNGATGVSRFPYVYVYCNSSLNTSTISGAVSISPSVAGNAYSYTSSGLYFVPAAQLAANTDYTVTIGTSLRSSGGFQLSAPYTFTFRTGN